jgi:hypothetical protein
LSLAFIFKINTEKKTKNSSGNFPIIIAKKTTNFGKDYTKIILNIFRRAKIKKDDIWEHLMRLERNNFLIFEHASRRNIIFHRTRATPNIGDVYL